MYEDVKYINWLRVGFSRWLLWRW